MMSKYTRLIVCLLLGFSNPMFSFISNGKVASFTLKDSLRGGLPIERSCFDVHHYDLEVSFNFIDSTIAGKNSISYIVKSPTKLIQLDLFQNMAIDSIVNEQGQLSFRRVENAVLVSFSDEQIKGSLKTLTVHYQGKVVQAKHAPWDGGFVWSKDSLGRPFIGVACEGLGASSWWPVKDHLSDKPDSMDIRLTVPLSLIGVANGEFIEREQISNENVVYHWKVTCPIINYNVSFYIGHFLKIQDHYISHGDSLDLSYYVLDYNINKAKRHFQQVKPMLKIYEELFGKYPFWNDGYKLVEAPYLGMEHQSAIAYGNQYKTGYLGHQMKGVDFDYVIIHESGHEYWGNSLSMQDIADMWIHEAFCTYTEALYVEKKYDYETMYDYIQHGSKRVLNDEPIIGHYHVNDMGSSDMYMKGAAVLHLLREQLGNDSLWFAALKKLQQKFAYQSVNSKVVIQQLSDDLGPWVEPVLAAYLQQASLPVLKVKKSQGKGVFELKWENVPDDFILDLTVFWKKKSKTVKIGSRNESFVFKKAKELTFKNDFNLFKVEYE